MARIERNKTPWESYILIIIVVVLGLVAAAVVLGPTGSQKEALEKIKPQDKSKMEKKDVFRELKEEVKKAKPGDRLYSELTEAEREAIVEKAWRVMVERGYDSDVSKADVKRTEMEVWRGGVADEKETPPDDAKERWRIMAKKKYENIRQINLKDETGMLNCPQIEIWEDAGRTRSAGQMNHNEWVVVLEEAGSMTKIKRRRDNKEGWIESKVLRRIYTEEDFEKDPEFKKDVPDEDE